MNKHITGITKEKPCKNHRLSFGTKMESNRAEREGFEAMEGRVVVTCAKCGWLVGRRVGATKNYGKFKR